MSANLLPSQVINARTENNNMSQAALAREVGLNRNILSAFEQGKLLLGPEMQASIVDFFEGVGVSIAPATQHRDSNGSESAVDRLVCVDRFQSPASMDEDLRQRLVGEIVILESVISESLCAPVELGFFGGISEESSGQHDQLLVCIAAWFDRVRTLQGWSSFSADASNEVSQKPASHAEWLGAQVAKIMTDVNAEGEGATLFG